MPRTLYGTQYGSTNYGGITDSDGQWQNLSSWWEDGFGQTQADAIPENGDTVFSDGSLTVGPAVLVTLVAFDNSAASGADAMDTYANVKVTSSLVFGSFVWNTDLVEGLTADFLSGSDNLGSIDGATVNFEAATTNEGPILSGIVSFSSASNIGTISGGTVTFADTSFNGAAVNANATLIYDADSFDNSVLSVPVSQLVGTETILSFDGGESFFYSQSKLTTDTTPLANKILRGTTINGVAGTAKRKRMGMIW